MHELLMGYTGKAIANLMYVNSENRYMKANFIC